MKRKYYQLIELFLIFILTLLFNIFCNELTIDELWNYGFSYNIATGLIPYKDFNMVITPLYPLLGAIFLKLFSYTLLSYQCFNAIICTIIFYYLKKSTPKAYYLIYAIFLLFASPNYSVLCLLFIYVLMDMEEHHKNDYLIGIILGLLFLTKQNVGVFLCIPTLFTKDFKKIFHRIAGFLIPNLILLIYLLKNNILNNFIEYCFLGLKSFANYNLYINKRGIVILILLVIYLIYEYCRTKDLKILYIIFFQFFAYPIFDNYHLAIPFIVVCNYIINKLPMSKKIISIMFTVFVLLNFANSYSSIKDGINIFSSNTGMLKYRKIERTAYNYIEEVADYINENPDAEVFVIDPLSYAIKLVANIKINKYDLLNNGNLGLQSGEDIIKEIDTSCQNKHCIFIQDDDNLNISTKTQYDPKMLLYITEKYKKNKYLNRFSIYKNY